MKFITDSMLGRLATWLRLLGYDTIFIPHADDHDLARRARAEERVLLTRDVELTRRRGIRHLLISSEKVNEQVKQVFGEFKLSAPEAFSRCAECNHRLESINKASVRGIVPPYVFHTQNHFRRCAQCGRVYWRGTHWARMVAEIENLDVATRTDI